MNIKITYHTSFISSQKWCERKIKYKYSYKSPYWPTRFFYEYHRSEDHKDWWKNNSIIRSKKEYSYIREIFSNNGSFFCREKHEHSESHKNSTSNDIFKFKGKKWVWGFWFASRHGSIIWKVIIYAKRKTNAWETKIDKIYYIVI